RCASPACIWRELAVLLRSSARWGVIACASSFSLSAACSSSSSCAWERRPSGRRSMPIAASIALPPLPPNVSRSRWTRFTGALAWQHILDNIHLALLMAVAIALLASLAIAHTLAPAQQIVAALQRMARGQYRTSLPRFRSMDLAMIGQAVGELGDRLAQAMEERAALTRRLLEIRSDERRVLARELHDEFGQNLAAILAFANTIEVASTQAQDQGRCEVAQDARMISQATHRIMACLRDTLKRLRHPPAEELGLEACLVDLVD